MGVCVRHGRGVTAALAIGSGSAYANDRLGPAAAMADSGRVTYIGFDCLAERTMALATCDAAQPARRPGRADPPAAAPAARLPCVGRPGGGQLRRGQPGRGGR